MTFQSPALRAVCLPLLALLVPTGLPALIVHAVAPPIGRPVYVGEAPQAAPAGLVLTTTIELSAPIPRTYPTSPSGPVTTPTNPSPSGPVTATPATTPATATTTLNPGVVYVNTNGVPSTLTVQPGSAAFSNSPAPPVAINPGTTLTLRLSTTDWTEVADVRWLKNDQPLDATGLELVLPRVTGADSASYQATFLGNGKTATTVAAEILVAAGTFTPLLNLSARGAVSAQDPELVVGFAIGEKAPGSRLPRSLMIRVIGPSLYRFGLPLALRDPEVKIHNADGVDVTPTHGTVDNVNAAPGSGKVDYYKYLAQIAARVGAFPIAEVTTDQTAPVDYATLGGFPPGTYTINVRSASGAAGDVMVEIYEIGP